MPPTEREERESETERPRDRDREKERGIIMPRDIVNFNKVFYFEFTKP